MVDDASKFGFGPVSLLMAMLFLVSGTGKLGAVEETQKYMEAYGVPGYLLYPAAALEVGGGGMLLAGLHTRWLGMVLSGWCLLTAFIFHTDLQDQNQKLNMLKNMVMAGGFLVLADSAKKSVKDESSSGGGGGGAWYLARKWKEYRSGVRGHIRLPAGEGSSAEKNVNLLEGKEMV